MESFSISLILGLIDKRNLVIWSVRDTIVSKLTIGVSECSHIAFFSVLDAIVTFYLVALVFGEVRLLRRE